MKTKDRVSFTAGYTQHLKSFSNIPYADIMAKAIDSRYSFDALSKNANRAMLIKAPIFEAWFVLITELLYNLKIKNILELGTGFDTRGLIMTEDPAICYVETDLPEIMRLKKKITARVLKKPRKNLHEVPLSFKDLPKMASIIKRYLDFPLAIVNTGLLTYFGKKEKMAFARAVRKILISNPNGGVWITPDFYTQRELAQSTTPKENKHHMQQMNSFVGFNKLSLAFQNDNERRVFFATAGFWAKAVPFSAVQKKLSSPKKLGLSGARTKKILGNRKVFLLTPR